jgi:hypothetical protein
MKISIIRRGDTVKRLLALLLALTMAFSSSILLFSCSDNEKSEKPQGNTGVSPTVTDEDSIFYERSLVSDGLGEADYGGRALRIVTYLPTEFLIEEEERNRGDLIKDAKFARNEKVESRFNAKLELAYTGTYYGVDEYVQKTVLSGSDEFDLLLGQAVQTGPSVSKNLYLNWYDIEHVDFSKPWWYSDNAQSLTYDGKAIIAVSYFNYTSVTCTLAMYFNKDLAAAYEMGDLYALALNGKWTWDSFYETIKDIYDDRNGNNERDDADAYGFAQAVGTGLNAWFWAFDNLAVRKDGEGIPQIAVYTDKVSSIVSKIYDLCYNTDGVFYRPKDGGYEKDMFLAGRSVFMVAGLSHATFEEFRNFESDYGLLPLPKWDESQSKYITAADGYHTVMAVPKTCPDTEFVGRMVEALSAETWKTVVPSFYEIALRTRYLRDNESKEVLDLIINGLEFDFGYLYTGTTYNYAITLQIMMRDGMNNFESYYRANKWAAGNRLKAAIKAFDSLT